MAISRYICITVLVAIVSSSSATATVTCSGQPINNIAGLSAGKKLADGTLIGKGRVNINIDGYGRAYHPLNAEAGALIHLCNAGKVYLPSGVSYHGSVDNKTCTGTFMADVGKIRAAGWRDPKVGAVEWYGILGTGSAAVRGRLVKNVVPVLQSDGSGFYVSPTSLADQTIAEPAEQSRYVHALRVPAAVIPSSAYLRQLGIVMGSYGVAYDPNTDKAVAFVVGDKGPRVGEATPALARSLADLPITDQVTRANRFAGQVDQARVIWTFFGLKGGIGTYEGSDPAATVAAAAKAFENWGGLKRLRLCM